MRIAIFHDYFGTIGGGEKVAVEMAKILDADIITTDIDAVRKIDQSVRLISLGKTIKYPGLKQISATLKFYFCDFSKDYDFFIFTGNWSHMAAHRHHPNIWYCYTPVRVFYDLYPTFLSRQDPVTRIFFRTWVFLHRKWDQRSIIHVDRIIAISRNVQDRISCYYHLDTELIYPPVDVALYRCEDYRDFWLSVNRLYPEKRIELQVEAFRMMPEERLVIVGSYARGDHSSVYAKKIQEDVPRNVSFLGEITNTELCDLFAHCRGFICTSKDEDFGLTPLEAMAAGKPVSAIDSGGFRETVTSCTGILVNPNVPSIVTAARRISEHPAQYREACIARAREFDVSVFAKHLRKVIDAVFEIPESV